jgi:hypothetical protein
MFAEKSSYSAAPLVAATPSGALRTHARKSERNNERVEEGGSRKKKKKKKIFG